MWVEEPLAALVFMPPLSCLSAVQIIGRQHWAGTIWAHPCLSLCFLCLSRMFWDGDECVTRGNRGNNEQPAKTNCSSQEQGEEGSSTLGKEEINITTIHWPKTPKFAQFHLQQQKQKKRYLNSCGSGSWAASSWLERWSCVNVVSRCGGFPLLEVQIISKIL